MKAPFVTIVLTSYNHGSFLSDCIESVLNQTFREFELVIVDDCSSDSSQDIIKKYAAADERIRYVFHETNWGQPGYDKLMADFQGEYIAIMHSDDMWLPTKLEKQVEYLRMHPEAIACFSDVLIITDDGVEDFAHPYNEHFKSFSYNRFQWLNYIFKTTRNPFCHPSILYKKEAFSEAGLGTKGLHSIPDLVNWVRLLQYGEVHVLPEKLTLFRVHSDGSNTSGVNINSERRAYTEMLFLYDEYRKITDLSLLKKIFPEASHLYKNGKGNSKFILAMMAIRPEATRQSKLFGLKLLYEMLNDPIEAKNLEELYGFGGKDFNRLKMENETFSIPMTEYASIYYAPTTDDFNESNKLFMYFVHNNDRNTSAEIEFDLSSIPPAEKKYLRFDPGEGKVIECHIDNISADGSSDDINIVAHNSYMKTQDDFDIFLTRDPMYLIGSGANPIDHLAIRFSAAELPPDYLEELLAEKDTLLAKKDAEIADLSTSAFNKLRNKLKRP